MWFNQIFRLYETVEVFILNDSGYYQLQGVYEKKDNVKVLIFEDLSFNGS